eukprot:COSAG04_NODE_17402_length_470_cov_0.843666_1_plen_143_part_10
MLTHETGSTHSSCTTEPHYVGCFEDRESPADGRDLVSARFRMGASASAESCSELCAGWQFIGLQGTDHCSCGNTYGSYAQLSNALCGHDGGDCGTGSATMCQWMNAVFRNPRAKTCEDVVCAAGTAPKADGASLSVRGELVAG